MPASCSTAVFASLSCPIIPATGQPACDTSNDVGSSSPDASKVAHVGNPIDVVSGNKYQAGVDVRFGASHLSLVRHYNSTLANINIGLGNGWRHSYSVALTKSGQNLLTIAQSDGRLIRFSKANEIFQSAAEADGYVVSLGDGRYAWFLPDGRQLQFQGSFLISVLMPDGEELTLRYRQSRLNSVSNESGQVIEFEYGSGSIGLPIYSYDEGTGVPPGHLAKVKLPDGTSIDYGYDKNQNLTSVSFPRGTRYTQGVQYRYQNPINPTLLTERTNAVGKVQGKWIYDDLERVSEYWSRIHVKPNGETRGKADLSLSYRIGQTGNSGSTHVVYRDGKERVYDWQLDDLGDVTTVVERDTTAATATNVSSEESRENNQSEEIPFLPFHGNA